MQKPKSIIIYKLGPNSWEYALKKRRRPFGRRLRLLVVGLLTTLLSLCGTLRVPVGPDIESIGRRECHAVFPRQTCRLENWCSCSLLPGNDESQTARGSKARPQSTWWCLPRSIKARDSADSIKERAYWYDRREQLNTPSCLPLFQDVLCFCSQFVQRNLNLSSIRHFSDNRHPLVGFFWEDDDNNWNILLISITQLLS